MDGTVFTEETCRIMESAVVGVDSVLIIGSVRWPSW